MSKCNYKSFVIVTRSAKKRQTCCHNKIRSGIFFHWNCAFDRKNEIWKKLWEKYFLQSALAEMCQFSHKKALALDWLLYSFFKGRTIFGRNNHKINLSKSGLLEQRCKYRWPILRGETDTNKATRAQVPGNKVDLGS